MGTQMILFKPKYWWIHIGNCLLTLKMMQFIGSKYPNNSWLDCEDKFTGTRNCSWLWTSCFCAVPVFVLCFHDFFNTAPYVLLPYVLLFFTFEQSIIMPYKCLWFNVMYPGAVWAIWQRRVHVCIDVRPCCTLHLDNMPHSMIWYRCVSITMTGREYQKCPS